jgi:hypothetical protein
MVGSAWLPAEEFEFNAEAPRNGDRAEFLTRVRSKATAEFAEEAEIRSQ